MIKILIIGFLVVSFLFCFYKLFSKKNSLNAYERYIRQEEELQKNSRHIIEPIFGDKFSGRVV